MLWGYSPKTALYIGLAAWFISGIWVYQHDQVPLEHLGKLQECVSTQAICSVLSQGRWDAKDGDLWTLAPQWISEEVCFLVFYSGILWIHHVFMTAVTFV